MQKLRLATRQSLLALRQTEIVKLLLQEEYPELQLEDVPLVTEGDRRLDVSLAKVGGKGLFIKELEQALLDGRADLAVHSMKDVPVQMPEGLIISAILKRADARDVLVSNDFDSLSSLPKGAVVGTSSLRRQCQLKAVRPDLKVASLRGNVQTRLDKLDKGEFAAIILAAACLQRLDLHNRITEYLPLSQFVPAVGQGAIGLECCEVDNETQDLLDILMDERTALCLQAERLVSERLEASCHTPLGVHARIEKGQFILCAFVANIKSDERIACKLSCPLDQAEELAEQMAIKLIKLGAKQMIEAV